MEKAICKTCGKIFKAETKREAEKLLWEHCDHDLTGEGTWQRTRYGSDA